MFDEISGPEVRVGDTISFTHKDNDIGVFGTVDHITKMDNGTISFQTANGRTIATWAEPFEHVIVLWDRPPVREPKWLGAVVEGKYSYHDDKTDLWVRVNEGGDNYSFSWIRAVGTDGKFYNWSVIVDPVVKHPGWEQHV